jgi:hypothetical protein
MWIKYLIQNYNLFSLPEQQACSKWAGSSQGTKRWRSVFSDLSWAKLVMTPLGIKGLDIRSRPLTFLALPSISHE